MKTWRAVRGVTLIELLVVVLVLSGGVLGLTALLRPALKASAWQQDALGAAHAGLDCVERLQAHRHRLRQEGSVFAGPPNASLCADQGFTSLGISPWSQSPCAIGLTCWRVQGARPAPHPVAFDLLLVAY
jgi:prepilin-type N-terminal cleavage/methylation domain-containing protein